MYELLFEESEAVQQEDTDALDQLTNRVDETLAWVAEAFNKSDRSVAARPPTMPKGMSQREMPGRSPTRPWSQFKLTQDHNPVELANWILQFKAYYTSSRLKQCPVAEQQAYFRNVIDVKLEARITDKILPDTPVVSDRANVISCISILEEEFDLKYPLFARKATLFNLKQKEGQLVSDFAAEVRADANCAKLHELKPEDIIMLIYVTGIGDKVLRDKLLKEREPNLALFHEIMRQHESAQFTSRTVDAGSGKKGGVIYIYTVHSKVSRLRHATYEQLKYRGSKKPQKWQLLPKPGNQELYLNTYWILNIIWIYIFSDQCKWIFFVVSGAVHVGLTFNNRLKAVSVPVF